MDHYLCFGSCHHEIDILPGSRSSTPTPHDRKHAMARPLGFNMGLAGALFARSRRSVAAFPRTLHIPTPWSCRCASARIRPEIHVGIQLRLVAPRILDQGILEDLFGQHLLRPIVPRLQVLQARGIGHAHAAKHATGRMGIAGAMAKDTGPWPCRPRLHAASEICLSLKRCLTFIFFGLSDGTPNHCVTRNRGDDGYVATICVRSPSVGCRWRGSYHGIESRLPRR